MVTLSTGWGPVVNVRAFYSDDSSLNPSYVYRSFSFEKAKMKYKGQELMPQSNFSITCLVCNKAFELSKTSHVNYNIQSDCYISAKR